MRGSITKRVASDGTVSYLVRILLGYNPKTGKRLTHSATIHGTRKDAERYSTKVLREIDVGTFREPSKVSLDEYFELWLEDAV